MADFEILFASEGPTFAKKLVELITNFLVVVYACIVPIKQFCCSLVYGFVFTNNLVY